MQGALSIVLALLLSAPQQQQQQQPVPDAPVPNAPAPQGLSDLKNQVTPGKAAAPDTANPNPDQPPPATSPAATQAPAAPTDDQPQEEAPEIGSKGSNAYILPPAGVNIVVVPVTVRDSKGKSVPGLTYRDFRVYENKERQRITYFSTDAVPLSVAFVIDQSVSAGTMQKVNQSLSAVTGAFTPYDEVAVYTYNNGPKKITDFTGAQGNRLPAALEAAKRPGREPGVPVLSGPMATGPTLNGKSVDPNLDRGAAGGIDGFLTPPKDVHTLNDAILFAAKDLSQRARGRRRIIYVVGDGKESGSKATIKEVIHFLLTNNISVYATLVGDSATWGYGYLDRIKLPLLPSNNVLPKYTVATGGSLDAEFQTNGMELSFSKIANEVRTQYTIEYHTKYGTLDSRYRTIEVTMPGRPGYDITAKSGYYPNATTPGAATH
jgi:VWFA-related protein